MSQEHESLEEHGELGQATGVELEVEPDETDDHIDMPFNPDRIDVTTRTPTVDLLLSRIRSGSIDLEPEFQRRRGIWTDKRQSRLIESLLLRIPLPTLYAAEDKNENWTIVDGIQRLTAIGRFIEPKALHAKPLLLRGLEYLGDQYEHASFADLPGRLQTRLRETELVLHLIRQGTPDEVKFNIFARINTGGMPLSAQELRHALVGGPIRARLKLLAESPEFREATGGSIRDERMADREMALRFIAFRLNPPDTYFAQDFDEFLRRAMRDSNSLSGEQWKNLEQDFRDSMQAATDIFGPYAFRKLYALNDYRYPINKALFDAVSGNLADVGNKGRQLLTKRREAALEGMIDLMRDYRFQNAISQGTGDVSKVRYRFERVAHLFGSVLDD